MKIKSFLIMVLSLISLTVAAQNGGIKGKVVSRATRTAIDGVKVTLTPGNVTTTTDEKGNFIFENLNKGEYSLAFEAAEYEPLSIAVRVDKLIRDINNVVLVPDNQSPTVDDAILAEFEYGDFGRCPIIAFITVGIQRCIQQHRFLQIQRDAFQPSRIRLTLY